MAAFWFKSNSKADYNLFICTGREDDALVSCACCGLSLRALVTVTEQVLKGATGAGRVFVASMYLKTLKFKSNSSSSRKSARWTHQELQSGRECRADVDPIASSSLCYKPIQFGLQSEAAAKSSKRLRGPKVMSCCARSRKGHWHNFCHLFVPGNNLLASALSARQLASSSARLWSCDPCTHKALSTLQFWQYLLDLQLTRTQNPTRLPMPGQPGTQS